MAWSPCRPRRAHAARASRARARDDPRTDGGWSRSAKAPPWSRRVAPRCGTSRSASRKRASPARTPRRSYWRPQSPASRLPPFPRWVGPPLEDPTTPHGEWEVRATGREEGGRGRRGRSLTGDRREEENQANDCLETELHGGGMVADGVIVGCDRARHTGAAGSAPRRTWLRLSTLVRIVFRRLRLNAKGVGANAIPPEEPMQGLALDACEIRGVRHVAAELSHQGDQVVA